MPRAAHPARPAAPAALAVAATCVAAATDPAPTGQEGTTPAPVWLQLAALSIDTLSRGIRPGEPGALRGLPWWVWGGPGCGKTALLRSLCRVRDAFLAEVIVSQRDPAELVGLAFVHPQSGEVMDSPAAWVREALAQAMAGRRIVLLLDELPRAKQEQQNVGLTLVSDRRAAGISLPWDTAFLAAGNQSGAGCDATPLDAAVLTRWGHAAVDPSRANAVAASYFDAIAGGASDLALAPSGLPAQPDPEAWAALYQSEALSLALYLRQGGGTADEKPADLQDGEGLPLPYRTPRTWDAAIRLRASCRATGRDDLLLPATRAWIGAAGAAAWAAWTSADGLPLAADVYAGRAPLPTDARRPDRTIQCAASCLVYVQQDPGRSAAPLAAALLPVAKAPGMAEVVFSFLRRLIALDGARSGGGISPECSALLAALSPLVRDAAARAGHAGVR